MDPVYDYYGDTGGTAISDPVPATADAGGGLFTGLGGLLQTAATVYAATRPPNGVATPLRGPAPVVRPAGALGGFSPALVIGAVLAGVVALVLFLRKA